MAMKAIKTAGRAVIYGTGTVVALIVVVGFVLPAVFDFSLPFTEQNVDRSSPVLLTEMNDLASFAPPRPRPSSRS